VEQKLAEAVAHVENGGNGSALEPEYVQRLYQQVAQLTERGSAMGQTPVLMTSPQIRPYVKRLFERVAARLPVISYNEIMQGTEIKVLGMVS
jgi:flagellar biosynthesis protein FlhA